MAFPINWPFQIQDFIKRRNPPDRGATALPPREDIQGMGFKIADQLAEELGQVTPQRFRAGLIRLLATLSRLEIPIEAKASCACTIDL